MFSSSLFNNESAPFGLFIIKLWASGSMIQYPLGSIEPTPLDVQGRSLTITPNKPKAIIGKEWCARRFFVQRSQIVPMILVRYYNLSCTCITLLSCIMYIMFMPHISCVYHADATCIMYTSILKFLFLLLKF